MRRIILSTAGLCLILVLFNGAKLVFADIDDVINYAQDIYFYATRASTANTLEDAKVYARAAMEAARHAQEKASGLDLDDVAAYARNAYDYARDVLRASTLIEAQNCAGRAANAAKSKAMDAKLKSEEENLKTEDEKKKEGK